MNNKFVIITIFFFFSNFNLAKSETNIVYIDMDAIMNKSIAGKHIVKSLNAMHEKNLIFFEKKEKELINKETKLLSQRNLLSKEELEKQLKDLRNEANIYRKEKTQKLNDFNNKKINATNILLKEIQPILVKYSNENSILLIFQKKDIIIGKSELDKTNDILKIIDNNITKINLN